MVNSIHSVEITDSTHTIDSVDIADGVAAYMFQFQKQKSTFNVFLLGYNFNPKNG